MLHARRGTCIVDFRPDRRTEERLCYLREKANEGTLSETERVEYQEFVDALDFVGLLKARGANCSVRRSRWIPPRDKLCVSERRRAVNTATSRNLRSKFRSTSNTSPRANTAEVTNWTTSHWPATGVIS